MKTYDHLVIGGGIIGLTVCRELSSRFPKAKIALLEKEPDVAQHSSGRNSGVLHAGFYYTADSLKARFTRDGNRLMKAFCQDNSVRVNHCGKLVVAKDDADLDGLLELKRRGDRNGVELHWVDAKDIEKIDANARTHDRALYSPATATVDPIEVCRALQRELVERGVEMKMNTSFVRHRETAVSTSSGVFDAERVINCAGLSADRIAHSYGVGTSYAILPIKGTYLSYSGTDPVVTTNIYPVPNLRNPFLGVHFTVSVDGKIKIGPTALPALGRESYDAWQGVEWGEVLPLLYRQCRLFYANPSGFRRVVFSELKKMSKSHFRRQASSLVRTVDLRRFKTWTRPGIRAQLVNTQTMEFVQDFVIEKTKESVHVLNVVSPGFTSAFPMAGHVVDVLHGAGP